MMQYNEIQQFKVSKKQKQTLKLLKTKYRINTSQFIRSAIIEKLEREKDGIFKNYNDLQKFIKNFEDVPF